MDGRIEISMKVVCHMCMGGYLKKEIKEEY